MIIYRLKENIRKRTLFSNLDRQTSFAFRNQEQHLEAGLSTPIPFTVYVIANCRYSMKCRYSIF